MSVRGQPQLLGREGELALIDRLLEAGQLAPTGLFIVGEAGIGKTTLLREGVARATQLGFRVLECAPAKPESRLAYSALSDMLASFRTSQLAKLPVVQRAALEVALLRTEPGPHSIQQSAVAAGMLSLLNINAEEQPVLVAIDDVQWIDDASAAVITFALRRISGLPLSVLITHRNGEPDPVGLGDTLMPRGESDVVEIGPLGLEDLNAVLRRKLTKTLPFPEVTAIHRACSGNPFLGVELARRIVEGRLKFDPGRPLMLPKNLDRLVAGNLLSLSPEAIRLLSAVAALSHPTIDELEALDSRAQLLLAEAERAGLIFMDMDRVRFVHPLLGSATYSRMSSRALRSLHTEISNVVGDVEEKARHLALAAEGPDEDVASALEDAAWHALSRGAPDIAADMLEEAGRMTPEDDIERVASRRGLAGFHHLDAGRAERAVELLEENLPLVTGSQRAQLLRYRALAGDEPADAMVELFEEALVEAGSDSPLQARILTDLSWNLMALMRVDDADPYAREAVKEAEKTANSRLVASALAVRSTVQFFSSGHIPEVELQRSLALQGQASTENGRGHDATSDSPEIHDSRMLCGLVLLWGDKLSRARPLFLDVIKEHELAGREGGVCVLLCYLSYLELRHGDWPAARNYALRCAELEERQYGDLPVALGGGQTLARVDACSGDLDAAETTARKGLESARHVEEPFVEMQYLSVLAFIAFMRADHHAVLAYVDELPERIAATGLVDPGLYRFEQVLLESHIALGNRARADSLVCELEDRAAKIGSGWAVAASLWCRGLFLAAEDEFSESLETLEDSVAAFEELDQPFELGRGLFTLGQTQRRARRKTAARASLDRASTIFSSLGATAWAARAKDETARIGGRPASRWDLTPTESRVAALVATGRTNRQVAKELVVSPKTVEWTLSNVYRKLQVHSRTALAERIHSSKRS